MTDRCLSGLAVRELAKNLRGVGFDSHLRLNFSVTWMFSELIYSFTLIIGKEQSRGGTYLSTRAQREEK